MIRTANRVFRGGDWLIRHPAYWNHNVAYYDWIKNSTMACKDILDVGCGDGSLVRYLDDGKRTLVGIDGDEACIKRALNESGSNNAQFIYNRFEAYNFEKKFDAVVFVASIHHMDMTVALNKAKSILKPDGMILIVGLAKPSNFFDWVVEAFRVIPCTIVSKIRHMQSSEDNHISVSYHFQEMNEIRTTADILLPSSKIKYGLFYRYLLWWKK
ncbi:class I SAM-dependent methyltransferase [uncultured Dysosmobacter sp.]|uniref:class I SAM-dependent methyltransferase n=1 Tax=uncultured Dysosmobacter sp. TaxID=2591384 RepID=UPI003424A220